MSDGVDEGRVLWIYREALDHEGDARERFIVEQCEGNSSLESEVRALLTAEQATGVLDQPPSSLLHAGGESAGDVVGPYRLLEPIGRGGMGVVFLAEQREPIERKVALKLIQSGLQTEEIRLRFEGERRALALMDHPNIARVYEAGYTDDGRPYFAMEHVPGPSITEFANAERLDIRERLELFLQVLEAIRHAHQKGIIHRDIKPGNVLVGSAEGRPRVKVIDFGVAKAIDRRLTPETLHTFSGRLVGTLEFMSPEQVGSERNTDDTRSDVYAAAMLLYELLVGALPFDRERFDSSSLAEIHHLICEVDTPRASTRVTQVLEARGEIAAQRRIEPTSLSRTLRGDLDAILMKGLEKAVTRRYQSAGEFRDDIVRFLGNRPIEARPPSAMYQLSKFVRRHRVGVTAGVLIVAALTVGMVGAWFGLDAATRALADVKTESAKRKAALTFFEDLLASASAESVQGRDAPVLLEALQLAADRADVQLAGFPEGEASVRCTIAEVFISLGRVREAEQQVTLAEKTLVEIEEPSVTLRAEVARTRGTIEIALGNLPEATTALESAIELADSIEAGDDKRSALRSRSRMALCQILIHTRDLERAEVLAREAVEISRDSSLIEVNRLAMDNQLALVLKTKGEYPEAERLYRACLARARELGENHPFVPQFENNLGMLLLYTERVPEAETLLGAALEKRERILEPSHERLAESYNNLALAQQNLDKAGQAIENFMKARAILEQSVEPNHPHVGSLSFNIAELHEDNEDYAKAVPEYRRAVGIDESNYGSDHLYVARGRFQLARALLRAGEHEEAEPIAASAIESYRASSSEEWRIARARTLHAACLVELGRFEDAEEEMLAAYEQMRAAVGDDHFRAKRARDAVRLLYEKWGKPEKAAEWE